MPQFAPKDPSRFTRKKREVLNPTADWRGDESWVCDTAYIYDGPGRRKWPVFVAVNNLTRYQFITRFPTQSASAANTVTCLDRLFVTPGLSIAYLAVDAGREFDNAKVKRWCAEHGVALYVADRSNTEVTSKAERAIGTLRLHLNQFLALYSEDGTWGDDTLEALQNAYNATKSRLGFAPADATHDTALQARLEAKAEADRRPYLDLLDSWRPGDLVRIWEGKNPLKTHKENEAWRLGYTKHTSVWGAEVWTVADPPTKGYRVRLEGTRRTFAPDELTRPQVVKARTVEDERKAEATARGTAHRKQVRRLAKEGLDIVLDEPEPVRPAHVPTAPKRTLRKRT